MYTDAHVHCPESASWEQVCPKNVTAALLNGTFPGDWPVVRRLAEREKTRKIYPFYGLHPWFSHSCESGWEEVFTSFLPYAAGVGEIGLDARRSGLDGEIQNRVFRWQLEWAVRWNKPVAIHSVHAWSDLVPILKEIVGKARIPLLFHAFQGTPELVEQLMRFRAYFSFAGCLRSSNAERFLKTLRAIPRKRLFLESDAATPEVAAGLPEFYKEVAAKLEISLEELCEQIRQNVETLFLPEAEA